MKIEDLFDSEKTPAQIVTELKRKTIAIPKWSDLEKEYDPKLHPVMDKKLYPDRLKKGVEEKVSRITFGLQKLATKRMSSMMFGIPVRRLYSAENEGQKKVAEIMEKIFDKARINSVNIKRFKMYFAACEMASIWYMKEEKSDHSDYGEPTKYKLRVNSFSPMNKYEIYPYFDEYLDLIALSFEYKREEGNKTLTYFDCYTKDLHRRYVQDGSAWTAVSDTDEEVINEKIPGQYIWRPEQIWEDTSGNIYEIEWAFSRAGNYIRKNAKPVFAMFTEGKSNGNTEKLPNEEDRAVLKFGKGENAKYLDWPQAIESLKFFYETVYRQFFTQIQNADISFDNMKSLPMSGESRRMMFIDILLKVIDEMGDVIEFLDREVRVVKSMMVVMYPSLADAINKLSVKNIITPFTIEEKSEKIESISSAKLAGFISTEKAVTEAGFVQLSEVREEVERIRGEEVKKLNGAYDL